MTEEPLAQSAPLAPDAPLPLQPDDASATDLLVDLYQQLRRSAERELRRLGPSATLSPTTLLHELYLDLQGRHTLSFPDHARFFTYAARAMRGLVIDYARRRQALKRGAGFEFTTLPTDIPQDVANQDSLQRLSEAVERLALVEPQLGQIVDLKYFSGFSLDDIAQIQRTSKRTVQRNWERARLFLHRYLAELEAGNPA